MKNAILLLALTVFSLSAFANKIEQSAPPLPASAPAAVKLIQWKTNYVDHLSTAGHLAAKSSITIGRRGFKYSFRKVALSYSFTRGIG